MALANNPGPGIIGPGVAGQGWAASRLCGSSDSAECACGSSDATEWACGSSDLMEYAIADCVRGWTDGTECACGWSDITECARGSSDRAECARGSSNTTGYASTVGIVFVAGLIVRKMLVPRLIVMILGSLNNMIRFLMLFKGKVIGFVNSDRYHVTTLHGVQVTLVLARKRKRTKGRENLELYLILV